LAMHSAADQLVGAFGPEAGSDRYEAILKPRLLPSPQRFDARAADCDLAHVKRHHGLSHGQIYALHQVFSRRGQ
jgi:hypothetical protein